MQGLQDQAIMIQFSLVPRSLQHSLLTKLSENFVQAKYCGGLGTRLDAGSFTKAISYLRCSPFKGDFSSMRYIVVTFFKISGHPKITNL